MIFSKFKRFQLRIKYKYFIETSCHMMQVSQISISSRINQNNSKTQFGSIDSRSTIGGKTSSQTFDSSSNISKASILLSQINKIQQAQIQMQRKFQKCIESLVKQIEQKENSNNKMIKEVGQLKANIQESKRDILTISGYVKNNIKTKNNTKVKTLISNSPLKLQSHSNGRLLKRSQERVSTKRLLIKGIVGK